MAVQAAVASDSPGDYVELLDRVMHASRSERPADVTAAARMLQQQPRSPQSERHIALFLGLRLWQEGHRESAIREFERVTRHPEYDTAFGIASHLIGAYRHDRGDDEGALPFLQQSIAALDATGDARGLHLALTTLGRTLRDFAAASELGRADSFTDAPQSEVLDLYEEALDALERAVLIAEEGLAEGLTALVPLVELAVTYRRMGAMEMAVATVEQSLDSLVESDPHSTWALTVAASLYREQGNDRAAGDAIDRAVALAKRSGTASLDLARALNVLATIERKTPTSRDAAVRHAAESVAMGRQLHNNRHTSQALHTYALALLGRGQEDDIQSARPALDEAEKLLFGLGDKRGLNMVRRTRKGFLRKFS
ncbi:hypothetical protein M3148_00170 [Georgenia satyanarayanai]|uniref:hypothetical protein n=1 Tax=Georgenia satyanarayanai TaxID=860221 RepID=UPI002041CF75|nr:hypothetical protein [Georgenia satyanarayanai]MCM3659416.1 hypothetical protein [Georgenia satyanarayanai]